MAPKKQPRQSLADYLTIAISPVLIMALIGSLIFFLLEVLYVGQYSGRMQWTLFFFVFGIVLIARISIELGSGRAMLYGIGLAFAVWLALQAYIEYPAGSPMKAFSGAINLGLIVVAWWCAQRLTWDCTYIDDTVDASGKGVLEAAGLDEQKEEAEESASTSEDLEAVQGGGLLGWWRRYSHYREKQLRKPHTPGVWVVYFSLAALPLFGLGQALIPAADAGRRRYVFWLMVYYVGSGLALLVTTSFLGLRRYLRQRKLKMPAAMTGVWMALGGGLIVLLMVVGALLPRPYGEYQLIHLNTSAAQERNASRYAVLREGAGKGEGRPSSDKARRAEDAQSGSGKQPDGKGESGKSNRSDGKSGQGGKGGGKQGNQQTTGREGNSRRQDDSQGKARSESKSGERRQDQTGEQRTTTRDAESRDRQDGEQNGPTGSRDPDQDGSGGRADTKQSDSSSTSLPHNPVAQVLEKLGALGTVLKWILFGILALVVLFFVLRSGLQFLANFTNWAKQLLQAFQAWWEGLFGHKVNESEAEVDGPPRVPTPRPFASFMNPFLDGRADSLSPDALTRYSFEALQAWAWEQDLGRRPQETPLEFAERLGTEVPPLEAEVRSLAGLYVRLAYARASLAPGCLDVLKRFWQRLEAVDERPVSA